MTNERKGEREGEKRSISSKCHGSRHSKYKAHLKLSQMVNNKRFMSEWDEWTSGKEQKKYNGKGPSKEEEQNVKKGKHV